MRLIVGFMFLIGVALAWILYKFDFSPTLEGMIISFIAGIIVFILISGLIYSNFGKDKGKNWDSEANIRKRKIRAHTVGLIFMILAILLVFNSYFYFKSLIGNDLLISLDVEEQDFVLKNGEQKFFDVKAKVLTNPFCSANCSLLLEDLSDDKILNYENIYLKVSSPLSKEYSLSSNGEKYGQKLYKLSLECNTIKEGKFCYTASNLSKLRTRIISINYELNDMQNIIKNALKNDTEDINREFYTSRSLLDDLYFNISSLDLSDLEYKSNLLKNDSDSILWEINKLNYLYEEQEYSELGTEIIDTRKNVNDFANEVRGLNNSLSENVKSYNYLVNNVLLMRGEIFFLEDYNFTNSSMVLAESFVRDFNLMIIRIKEKNRIEDKLLLFNKLEEEKQNLLSTLQNEINLGIPREEKLGVSISPVNIQNLSINHKNYFSYFSLEEPSPVCCFKQECYNCIEDSSLNYPIILVHGHSFNERLSAELSMESFSDMARTLEKDGYLDAGYFYRSEYDEDSKGYLGKINTSIVVEATYYIDTALAEENSFIYDSKWESIDTYAARLNEIISNVKYLTGKNKVIVVGHSMGSLVTRRYIQLYGESNLDKVILVGGPNHGIDGLVLNSCAVFGADLECSEMNKSSSFMQELNTATIPNIPVYNIIGIGCPFEGSNTDGIVKNESAYLDWADNIYVNGTCTGVDFFHVRMIKPTLHPEIYGIIKGIIEEDSSSKNM
ncbi:MAG: alpha/beta fold hydrolase [Nanobdellota archaeon]